MLHHISHRTLHLFVIYYYSILFLVIRNHFVSYDSTNSKNWIMPFRMKFRVKNVWLQTLDLDRLHVDKKTKNHNPFSADFLFCWLQTWKPTIQLMSKSHQVVSRLYFPTHSIKGTYVQRTRTINPSTTQKTSIGF